MTEVRITEEEMSAMEAGMTIITKTLQQAHFIATELRRIGGDVPAEIPDGAFDESPPEWAQEERDGGLHSSKCPYCGSWRTALWPLGVHCHTCADGSAIMLARVILTRAHDERNLVDMENVQSLIDQG